MDQNRELPVPVPEGYALVPLGGAHKASQVRDWHAAIPEYDPQDQASVIWSNVMRWPRRLAVGFLYLTWTWKRSAWGAGVAVVVIAVARSYMVTKG